MQLISKQEKQEKENGDYLASVVNVDTYIARRMLRKHNGDVDKAADAILAGDLGEDVWHQHRTTPEPMYSQDGLDMATPTASSIVTPIPSSSVIDLTTDDEELTRAIQMSMEDSSQTVPTFTASQRAPHPDWQMVRSNAPVSNSTTTHEDHSLNEAIQASLKDFTEDVDVPHVKQSIREGGRPIALCPSIPSFAYAALVLQALYFVPQVRSAVAILRLPEIDPQAPFGDSSRAMRDLIELFANMDLAQLATLIDVELLPSLGVGQLEGLSRIGEAAADVVAKMAKLIEDHIEAESSGNEEIDRLFSFSYNTVKLIDKLPQINNPPQTSTVVAVDFGGDSVHNDLISCLSDNLNKFYRNGSRHEVIIKPSEVCTFHLRRAPVIAGHAKASPDPFVFPKSIFLDRFLFHNLEFTNEKRELEQRMTDEIKELMTHKATLTRFNDRDTVRDLRATIHYYEHVAQAGDDPDRQQLLKRTIMHLQDVMTMIMGKVEDIDHEIERLQAEVATLYDCPELQQYQYDLRAVLVHTGFPGRKQIYSYVQDIEGVWWKTVDHEVTGVPEETVLTDPAGLHFGSGPFLIFYSRHLTDEQLHEPLIWPSLFSESVEENNKKLLAALHPELEIFSRISPEVPVDVTQAHGGREGQPVSRQSSRVMTASHD
ncbi:hypothetical protein BYT27DRAFT_7192382 [Phlegmacium glaucopus]|nr:hypothetical protein BYT27DRAFT_7192382 [Phlegmacium glaucopus]